MRISLAEEVFIDLSIDLQNVSILLAPYHISTRVEIFQSIVSNIHQFT